MILSANTTKKLGIFFCLYIAQTIPMSFFSTVIPVLMRQDNFSLASIGMLQLIKLPWILKFLWSPFVDRSSTTLKHYKYWIFSSELIYASIIFMVAFLNFTTNFYVILGLIITSFIASATQDIATDALAVLSFSKRDKSLANSMQSMGSFAGTMIGSGLLLLLFKQFGWERILPFLAVFVLVALIPLYFYRGKGIDTGAMKQKAKKADVLLFFTQKGIGKQILFLFFFYSGLIGILAMLKPFMVDLGYDMKKIGVMSGIAGTSIGFMCSFAGGFILRKLGLYKTRITFAGLILMTCAYFYTISLYTPSTVQLYIGIFLLWGSYGMATIVVYTSAMLKVRPGREGTDFTIQTVITHLSGMFMAIIGGRIADHFGYNGLFLIETFIAMISFVYVTVVMKESKQEETSDIESTNCTSIEAIQE